MTDFIRHALRRLDDWTLVAFNPQPSLISSAPDRRS